MSKLRMRLFPERDHEQPGGGASQGQILIMFALFLTVLLGAAGLSMDLGMAFSQRRAMQNAADAGALAGAKLVSRAGISTAAIQTRVESIVQANAMDYGSVGTINCLYIDDAGGSLGSCANAIPGAATGVQVTVDETHSTFFIQVLPGVGGDVTTSAVAAAHVKTESAIADGPFIPCGQKTRLSSGGTMDLILQSGNGGWVLNPDAVGRNFAIHGPKIEDCDVHPSEWKGLNDVNANTGKDALEDWFQFAMGTSVGTITVDVEGPDGCKAGQEVVNCVAFLPIAINKDQPLTSSDHRIWIVAYAPFYITKPSANTHNGKLLIDYIVYGRGENGDYGWNQNHSGPIVVRLTE